MGSYLQHIPLIATGRVRRTEREDVDARSIEICAALLATALRGESPIVPGIFPQLAMTATGGGQCVSITLRPAEQLERDTVFTIGISIAGKARCGAELWRKLQAHSDPQIQRAAERRSIPPAPWCATRIETEGQNFRFADGAAWSSFDDLERALAWAFLDRPPAGPDAA